MNRGRARAGRSPIVLVASALLAFAAVGAVILLTQFRDSMGAERRALEAEFTSLYPVAAANGQAVEVDLVVSESSLDLVAASSTGVWAYNGQVPGPQIRVELGQTVRATLHNQLPDPTTIHWHGVRVPNNMDGVPELNQDVVPPGESFVYEFTPPDSGTYWYHSHTDSSQQLERGLYGTLIVDEPGAAGQFDDDVTWVLDDWLLTGDGQVDPAFNTNEDRSHNGRWGDVITVNSSLDQTLPMAEGERVRIRLINAANGRVFSPDFGGLDAQVIAVDGQPTDEPLPLSGLKLAPGNRFDVVITGPPGGGEFSVTDAYLGMPIPLASVDVSAASPTTSDSSVDRQQSKSPDWSAAANLPADLELVFETAEVDGEWIWMINGKTFDESAPFELSHGEFTKIRLVNLTHPLHPIHLHGQFFKVLSRNGEPLDDGHFQDTVLLEGSDVVEIGLVPTDRGQWMLHCHIQEHAEAGMAVVVNVS